MPIWSIWIGVFVNKVAAIMASRTSKADAADGQLPIIDIAVTDQHIAARKAALGLSDLPRNSGKRRTASKQALLKAIEDAGGKW